MIDLLKAHPFFSSKNIESCTLLAKQGYCNENYLVIVDNVKYIVRKLLRNDIDRDFEWKVQNLVYRAGISAKPLVYDALNELMVFEFLEGIHKSDIDVDLLKLLAKRLKTLHNISIDVRPKKLAALNKTEEVQRAFKIIDNYPKEYVLCHNDLNPQNIFFSENVMFIDWEYAGVNDKYFDLACICVEFKLDTNIQKIFMMAYFEGADFSLEKLEAYKIIYRITCEEWFNSSNR